jgi:chitosanase
MSCQIGSSYKVQSGDTLFDIAEQQLGSGERWKEIMKPNGTPFSEEEAEDLQTGQEICLPTGETPIDQSTTQAIPGVEFFPPGTLNQLNTLTGLDAQQIANILGMINGPEQSNSKWWQTADNKIIYGYAEDIDDGRGVTIGIYGATTGKNYNDADIIWENYGQDYSNLPTDEIIEKVNEIANDPKWWKAQWDAYISTYWQPTLKLLKSKNYSKALTIGVLIDTAMNAGMEDDNSKHWGVNHLFEEASSDTNDEQDFLNKFIDLRLQYPTKNSGDMKERIGAWQNLLRDNQWDLRVDLNKYVYIPE